MNIVCTNFHELLSDALYFIALRLFSSVCASLLTSNLVLILYEHLKGPSLIMNHPGFIAMQSIQALCSHPTTESGHAT
jgi:hypothetical protein